MAQQQPAYVRIQPPEASVTQPQTVQRGGYKSSAGRITGGIQIACGALSIALGISEIFFAYFTVGEPIWGGVLYVIAGSLGVPTKKERNCLIIAYMVMSIISATFVADKLIRESIVASLSDCSSFNYCDGKHRVFFGLHLAVLLISALEMLAAIIGSAFCCHGVCCTTNQTTSFVVQYNHQMQQQTGQNLQQQVAPAQYQPPPGRPMQYQPLSQYPQGAQAQFSPQGATGHFPEKGPPPAK